MKLANIAMAVVTFGAMPLAAGSAHAEASIFELRISNETDTDLTFRMHEGQSKHARLTYNKKSVKSHTIKSGTSDIIGVQPTGKKCAPNCGGCTPTKGKVYASYIDANGKEQINNYHKPSVEFFEYCGSSGGKSLTTYTSNWSYDHGKGTSAYPHPQKASTNSYTSSNPAKGLTLDGKYIKGHATITYKNK